MARYVSRIRKVRIAALAGVASFILVPAAACARPAAGSEINVGSQSLGTALTQLGRQTRTEILFSPDAVVAKTAPAVKGSLSVKEAIDRLLAGSGLQARETQNGAYVVEVGNAPGGVDNLVSLGEETEPNSIHQEVADGADITVTGTRIHGARPSSPVLTLTQKEMRRAGHNDLGEVIRAIPQNFGGGQNPTLAVGTSAGRSANQNNTGASAINLRGLGPDATLTLLNGARLPYDGFYQATDVSIIPVAAIDRVEILLDGASAIYGSDAIAGVANIILKRDYEGMEVSARYGQATDGGYSQQQYTAVAGTKWGSGGFLVSGDFSKNNSVRASERDYLTYLSFFPDYEIYPRNKQISGLFSGHQNINDYVEVTVDAFYADRSNSAQLPAFSAASATHNRSDTSLWGISPALRLSLPGGWSARLQGTFGEDDSNSTLTNYVVSTGSEISKQEFRTLNRGQSLGLDVDGPLFSLPGGDARLAVGGGWRRNTLVRTNTAGSSSVVEADASSHSYYGYGEVNFPLLSPQQGIPLVNRLAVSAAIRHESYDSWGATTTPKAGLLWSLAPGFDLKASWGRSFKAPTLYEQFSSQFLYLVSVNDFLGGASVGAPADAQGFLQTGGNPNLKPEKAEAISVGFTANPDFLPGFNLELNWFEINIKDRVVTPVTALSTILTNPAYSQFTTLNPSSSEIADAFAWANLPAGAFTGNFAFAPYDPAKVLVIVHDGNTNTAAELLRGIDVSAGYQTRVLGGQATVSASGSWITAAKRKLTATSPVTPTAGAIFFPPKFKGRMGASWTRDGLTLAATLYHIGGVKDTNTTANIKRKSMTTLDLVLDYETRVGPLGNIGVGIAATNVFDKEPPFMQPANTFTVNYDSTNYSALGRVLNVSLRKRF